MRICIFTNHFFPEDFKVNDIAFELQKEGFDVTVLTAIPDYPKGKYYDGYGLFKRRHEIVNGVEVYRLPIIPRGKGGGKRLILNYISYYICLRIFVFFHKFFHKYDAVFVHLTSPFFVGNAAKALKKFQKIPMFFWTLDLWPESLISAGGITNPLIIKPQVNMVRKVYQNSDKILIGSKGFEKSICEKGDFKDKLVYFPNWAETEIEADSNFDLKSIRPFDNATDNDFIILFAGNLGEAQNLDAIIDAAEILKENENIKFVFVGDGRKKEHLELLVKEKKLDKTVYLTGRFPLNTMSVFMKNSSVLLFSLKDEPCFNLTVPSKVQFYMAQGKPILAMINGDGADLVKEAKCGFVVPAGDSENLAKKINELSLMDKEILKGFGMNGKKYYETFFSKNLRVEQLKKLFNSVEKR